MKIYSDETKNYNNDEKYKSKRLIKKYWRMKHDKKIPIQK